MLFSFGVILPLSLITKRTRAKSSEAVKNKLIQATFISLPKIFIKFNPSTV